MNFKIFSQFTVVFFISLNLFGHEMKCEIYDLPSGENLVETRLLMVSDEMLRKTDPHKIFLQHDLISAEFSISYSDENFLLFEIKTYEVSNSDYVKFTIPVKDLNSTRLQKLGHLSTELTGIGNNTFSQCYLKYY